MKNIKKISYDSDTDIFWILLKSRPSEYYKEPAPWIRIEFDKNSNVMGIEIENFSSLYKSDVVKNLKKDFDLPFNLKIGKSV